MLAHEKLQVYGKAVKVVAQVFTLCAGWDKRHALVDHLSRASESIVINLAEAARLQGSRIRLSTIDYAIIAEGNGRYAYLDRRRFLRTAHSALVKTAAYRNASVMAGKQPGQAVTFFVFLLPVVCM